MNVSLNILNVDQIQDYGNVNIDVPVYSILLYAIYKEIGK